MNSNVTPLPTIISCAEDCRVDHYYVFRDINGNMQLDDDDLCCFRKCGNDNAKGGEEKDSFLCGMQGENYT